MSFLRWIIGFLIAALVMLFAVSNRHDIEVYWSLSHSPFEFPLYLTALGLMAVGFVLGAFITWMNAAPLRKTKREQKKQIKALEKKLEAVNENGEAISKPPSDFFPVLPLKGKRSKQ